MKKIYLLLSVAAMLCFASCQDEELQEVLPVKKETSVRKINPREHAKAGALLENLAPSWKNARQEGGDFVETPYGTLSLKQVVETSLSEGQASTFTIRLLPPDTVCNVVEFLNLVPRSDGYYGYIVQYEAEGGNMDFSNYSGAIRILDLDRSLESTMIFVGGVQQEGNNSSSGRMDESYENCDCKYTIEKVEMYDGETSGGGFATIGGIECACDQGGSGTSGETSGETSGGESGPGSLVGSGSSYSGPVSGGTENSGDGTLEVIGFEDLEPCPQNTWNTNGECCPYGLNNEGMCMSEEEARFVLVKEKLEEDPFALLDVDCEELSEKWAGLAKHKPNQEVKDRIVLLNQNGYDIEMQYIEDADGAVVNMDYFPVQIKKLPKNPATGNTFTGKEFFDYIRKNFADICFSDNSEFGPYNQTEAEKWNSSNYLGAIMRFDIILRDPYFGIQIGQQDGSVICTNQQTQSWIFSTIYTSQDYNHPVSGNREFGLTLNPDGSYTFFTRGVDRIAEWTDVDVGGLMDYNAFDGGEELWSNLQSNLKNFINKPENGGEASVAEPAIERINNTKLEAVLNGTKPVSELGCNK